jgi:hypothetical protein
MKALSQFIGWTGFASVCWPLAWLRNATGTLIAVCVAAGWALR